MTRAMARREGGFTLAEMLVAITVFTVGALGVMAVHTATSRANQAARRLDRARSLADQVMESVRGTPMATLAPAVPTVVPLADKTIDGVVYHRRYSVSAHPLSGNLRRVWVQVTYGDFGDENDLHAVTINLIRTAAEAL